MGYKQYDPEVLKKLQCYCGKVLKEFDRICQTLNITYFIYGGTAIGALRDGGFIPWDDDIDVALPRNEYERFLDEAPQVMNACYEISNGRTSLGFPACITRFSLKDTLWVPEEFDSCKHSFKIGIDVFPLDSLPDDSKKARKKERATWLWGRMVFLKATPRPHITQKGLLRKLILAACRVAHEALNVFGISQQQLYRKWEDAAKLYNDIPSRRIADFTDRNPEAWSMTLSEIIPTKRIPFEDFEVQSAHDDAKLLYRGYGDFMQLPPESERKNHYPSRLIFPGDTNKENVHDK